MYVTKGFHQSGRTTALGQGFDCLLGSLRTVTGKLGKSLIQITYLQEGNTASLHICFFAKLVFSWSLLKYVIDNLKQD